MAFVTKDWRDAPEVTTPISAAALEDLETRVTDYTDDRVDSDGGPAKLALDNTFTETQTIQFSSGIGITAGRSDATFPAFQIDANWEILGNALVVQEIGDLANIIIRRSGPDGGAYNATPTAMLTDQSPGYIAWSAHDGTDWSPPGYNAWLAQIFARTVGVPSSTNRGGSLSFGSQNQDSTPTLVVRERILIPHDGGMTIYPKTNAAGTNVASKTNLNLTGAISGNGLTIGDCTLYYDATARLKTDGDLFAVGRVIAGQGSANAVNVGEIAGFKLGSGEDVQLRRTNTNELSLGTDDSLRIGEAAGAGGNYVQFFEQSADPSGVSNAGRLFAKDNGSGKTQLAVRFGSGATVIIATEP